MAYLWEAIKDPKATEIIKMTSMTPEQYVRTIRTLKERYDQRRFIHQSHVRVLFDRAKMRTGSVEEVCSLRDHITKHVTALKDTGQFDAGAIVCTRMLNTYLHRVFERENYSFTNSVTIVMAADT